MLGLGVEALLSAAANFGRPLFFFIFFILLYSLSCVLKLNFATLHILQSHAVSKLLRILFCLIRLKSLARTISSLFRVANTIEQFVQRAAGKFESSVVKSYSISLRAYYAYLMPAFFKREIKFSYHVLFPLVGMTYTLVLYTMAF